MLGSGARFNVIGEAQRLLPLFRQYVEIVDSDFTGTKDFSQVEADVADALDMVKTRRKMY